MIQPENIDLLELTRDLANALDTLEVPGFVVGKTVLRDAVAQRLSCSQLEAETLVDTLAGRGFIRFDSSPSPGAWALTITR